MVRLISADRKPRLIHSLARRACIGVDPSTRLRGGLGVETRLPTGTRERLTRWRVGFVFAVHIGCLKLLNQPTSVTEQEISSDTRPASKHAETG